MYKIEFSEQEMRVLNASLAEMPYRLAAPVIQSINRQIAAAQNAMSQVTGQKDHDHEGAS